ncbi:MAG: aminotransferase class I/II-fold pyridoxal phosphate-dependent enzyme [Gammaproteobacteria bacterium]|nr:aminotransferase class I/II-fold pyridoxal phosphate-dependent enzyme [Gammaproteobacteria bacterium]
MRKQITELETIARRLEPSPGDRKAAAEQVMSYANEFLDGLPDMPVYVPGQPDAGFGSQVNESPQPLEELLGELRRQVDTFGINPASGAHLGYIPGGGVYYAALGDFLADISNRYSGIAFASPGAAQLEQKMVRWMADLVGFGDTAGGDLTSGGSIANLSGIVAAREAHAIPAAEISSTCVYFTAQVHHCVTKALGIAGLKECVHRQIPMDERFRLDAEKLEQAIAADRAAGLKPWLVVASAGTTDTGAADPLARIAKITERNGLWLHVDAAYGGAFLLTDYGREVMRGIDRADSAVIDPHKGFFLPYGSGALLVRDQQHLAQAHSYHADYMQDAQAAESTPSPASLSPELTRPFRGLRLWLPLRLYGLAPFRAALDEKLLLARYFHQQLSQLPNFEVGPAPDLSVVIYRYRPQNSTDIDGINRKLVEDIQRHGEIFVSSTLIDGQYMLRLAVLNFRTHLNHIDRLLELLQSTAASLDH